ncbi:MAG TPA: SRPBCC family protein [Steroidobacteraceae bacterium]
MATIRKEILINAPPHEVWDVIRDVGAIHTRFAPGYVLDTRLEEGGGARIVTFANGTIVRERIVTLDNDARRLAYAVVDGRASHHNASFQVFPTSDGHTSLVWITDVLPDTVGPTFAGMIEGGAAAIKRTFEAH